MNHLVLSRRAYSAALIAFAMLVLAAMLAGSAAASPGAGKVSLSFRSDAQGSLSKQGVKVTSTTKAGKNGSAKRASGAQAVSLPVGELTLGATPQIHAKGGLRLSVDGRSAKLGNVTVQVGSKSTAIAAKVGGEQLVFFRAKGKPEIDASSVKLEDAALSLTGKGAKALRKSLGIEALDATQVGTAAIDARLLSEKPKQTEPTATAEEPRKIDDGGLLPPSRNPYPFEAQCPVPAVPGNPGFGTVPGAVSGSATIPTFNPGTSQSAIGSSIDWGFKGSFCSYVVNVPPAGSLLGLDGADTNPVGGSMASAGSFFGFPVSGGSYEAGSAPDHSDDRLVANGLGTALFCKAGHGFSVALKDPTVVIDGASSRIVADVGVNQNGTWYPFQRTDIAELDLSGIEPQIGDGGNKLVWEDIPATLTADGSLAAGIYEEGEGLDPITVETALQRPMLAQCGIAAGIAATPPAVDFTKAALPTLSSPVTGSGGTINWGFRPSLRASVAATGSFQLLGGATEGFPGSMGGSSTKPVSEGGGQGKFFRFPVSRYAYEEGTPDPADDRLIATSDATVGFCNPAAGNYGVVISKPTLVIDGANSRLIANAYSYSGGFPTPAPKGWIGGRVDLVHLNPAAAPAATGPGTVSWGEITADNAPILAGIPVDFTGGVGLRTEALSLANLTEASTSSGGFDQLAAQIELPTP